MTTTPEQRKFLDEARLAILGVGRDARAPHMSPVYYDFDGDEIVISTTASRFKAKAVRRGAPVSLCVIAEKPPFPYVFVEGAARIEDAGAVDAMLKIGARMTGAPIPDTARPALEQRAKDEGRVVLRVKIERVVAPMPLPRVDA